MRNICVLLCFCLLCGACREEYDHKGKTPLAELKGNFLYQEDLLAVLPKHLSPTDSLAFAERYLRNWAEDVLLYDKARRNIQNDAEIERLVANYRKSLIMHTYRQALIHQKLADQLSEEELLAYYDKNRELFKLEHPLMKGLFIKVPLKSPDLSLVRRCYKSDEQEAVEKLEKYSLKHAVKYEYFYDKWLSLKEVLDWLPLKVADAEGYIEKNRQVELKDTAFHYFLNVTEFRAQGEQEPFESARAQVADILLNLKQVDFMNLVKQDLYRQAVEDEEIKYFNIERE
ncbi:MAG: peptidyl-prolyl cis-trans isomerase [Bacteroides sp.]|nr:peptidyl-prolyl cis-trans isomerase [Bacteroides sp.]